MGNPGIKSLENAISVLMSMSGDRYVSVTELSEKLAVTKGAVSKILATYRRHGFVIQDPETRKFKLGPTLIHLGYQSLNQIDLREIAKPFLKELAAKYLENTMIMIAEGEHAMIIEQCESPLPVKLTMRLGEFYPLCRGAAPKLLLAYMPPEKIKAIVSNIELEPLTKSTILEKEVLLKRLQQIRKDGYCVSKGEIVSDAMAIAVPIRTISNNVGASLAMSGPRARMEKHDFAKTLDDLLKTVQQLSAQLGVRT